jgi:hypothetical protein
LGYPGGAEPPGDDSVPSDGLPRRERASLRGDAARRDAGGDSDSEPSPEISAEVQAAARRAFADDITAFSLGSQEPGSQEPTGKGTPP